jgi:maltose alpha-D-glucosyltransferase/alpha-amylase
MVQTLLDPVIQRLEQDLPNYLTGRRWYRAKAQTISALTIQDIIHVGGFLILLVNVQYSGGTYDLYLIPVTSVTKPTAEESLQEPITTFESSEGDRVNIYDAVLSPFFRTTLFRALASGTQFQGQAGFLTSQSTMDSPAEEGTLQSSVSSAEQSNTSIIYGREFILKLFRKIESGINPDIEIGAFLTNHGFKNTPAVVATLEYRAHNGEAFSAGILQKFVANQGDAWKYTLECLAAFYPKALNSTLDSPQLLGDYPAAASLLGIRTAQMHTALSESTADPDFNPESFTTSDAQTLSDEIAAQAKTSLDLLRAKSAGLPYTEQQLAIRVLDLESRIVQRFSILPSLSTDARRIRHHGDYHLGQILYTGSDFMIIDFEGEPARPLRERRAKALALRDVAGMLRSFQYAAYAGLYGLIPGLPNDPESTEKVAACSAFWNAEVSRLFLEAYFKEAGSKLFVPSTSEQRRLFLDAFLLQKALYEVQYELNNRPAWVGIPLRGIVGLIESS